MTKKDKEANGTDQERTNLYITQLKIVALNNRVEALKQHQRATSAELNLVATRLPEVEKERDQLLNAYKPAYEKLKAKLEVPEGHELNLETGEVAQSQQ